MTRATATRLLVQRLRHEVVVSNLGQATVDLQRLGDRPLNCYTFGSMGQCSSIGLGIALARPDLRVFVLDGDGSLLMNLGSLATIGLLRPDNLVVVVMDNEEYATTGGQRTATAHGADLAAAATAMGIAAVTQARTADELRAALAGSRLIVAKVAESGPAGRPATDCVFLKQRFMAAIGNPEAATEGR
jgi:thiamine pyrophosphate-dependent acetolactate synthase large subunit-like protein